MYDNYHYPAGADTEDAPWNEPVVPEKDFDITCSQTLSKTVTVTTDNYTPGACGVDYESDDEGGVYAVPYCEDPNTSDTDWENEFHENNYHTPLQLIGLFKQCLEQQMSSGLVFKSPAFTEKLIRECDDWTDDETVYVEG